MRRLGQRLSKTSGSAGATPPASADPAPSPFGPVRAFGAASVRDLSTAGEFFAAASCGRRELEPFDAPASRADDARLA